MSQRGLHRTLFLKAQLDGSGNAYADPYTVFPRAFLSAHLDDGIMETVVTNWGNDGIRMEMVGPALAGRPVAGLGAVQPVALGGALYFDPTGKLAYDPSTALVPLQARIAADEALIAALQAQIADLQAQIDLINQTAQFQPVANARLAATATLQVALSTTTSLAAQADAVSSLQANLTRLGVPLSLLTITWSAFGTLSSVAGLISVSLKATLAGSGTLSADPTITLSKLKQGQATWPGSGSALVSTQMLAMLSAAQAGASNLTVNLAQRIDTSAKLAGFSTLLVFETLKSVNLIAALNGSAGMSAPNLQQRHLYTLQATLSAAGALTGNIIKPTSALDPTQKSQYVTLSNNNKTATGNGGNYGIVRGIQGRSSGKYYFEVTVTTFGGQQYLFSVGVVTTALGSGYDSAYVGSDVGSMGVVANNTEFDLYFQGAVRGFLLGRDPLVGDVFQIAVDMSGPNTNAYFGINNSWYGGGAAPGTGTSLQTTGPTVYPAVEADITVSLTINTGSTAFAYTPPSGFIAWG